MSDPTALVSLSQLNQFRLINGGNFGDLSGTHEGAKVQKVVKLILEEYCWQDDSG
ncbi:MAG: hypothetical protein R2880_09185 [Deinococcales bacterium]